MANDRAFDTALHDLPNNGAVSDVWGTLSAMTSRKTENERSTVIPSDTFSPDSGGRQKTSRSSSDNMRQGNIMFIT